MLSSGANVIIWDEMLQSGMKCYHLELSYSTPPFLFFLETSLTQKLPCFVLNTILMESHLVVYRTGESNYDDESMLMISRS
jgi:hypothetical protein